MTDALAINLEAPCWLMRTYSGCKGYAKVYENGKTRLAHRYMWTVMRGPIPAGLQIDHLCRVRNCVNPQHMELVTLKENLRRGINFHATRTHCPAGHPYDETNTRLHGGKRYCRTCQRTRDLGRPNRHLAAHAI